MKLRFPSSIPFSTTVRNRYGLTALSLYRNFEKSDYKLRKVKLDLEFLTKCKTYGIIPKFLKFKLYNSNITRTLTYKSFQFKLLNYEINVKNKLLKRHEAAFQKARQEFRGTFSSLDSYILSRRLFKSNDAKIESAKITQGKKLASLGISSHHTVDRDKVVINLSKRKLTENEKEILSFGLNFALPKMKIDYVLHYFHFEKFVTSLKKLNCSNFTDVAQGIASVAHNSFKDFPDFKVAFPKLTKKFFDALKSLQSDKSIIITRPDKGRGTVVLDKNEYISKVEEILNDDSKFKCITLDPFTYITKLEDKLARLLRKFLKLKVLTKEVFNELFSSGSSLGVFYGLPKIHKAGFPIRPIISTIGTFNYNLAKYLVKVIEPITTNKYTLKNSHDFVNEIKSVNMSNKVMASFDVKSLFTNIPLDETIEIILNGLFENPDSMKFSRNQFKELLELGVKESPFLFNEKVYIQTDGVAMGSCLGPTFANAFLCYHEEKWLANCPSSFKPNYYRRYVDDTFLLFEKTEHISLFLDYLNAKHPNIKFTCDKEENDSLPFLDVRVTRQNNAVNTSIFRKPTFTGLGLNYTSFTPRLFKINSIKTLLYRCYALSSNWLSFHEEVEFLKTFFQNNGYPLNLINNCVTKFLDRLFAGGSNDDMNSDNIPVNYIKLPYYGHLSFVIRKQLNQLLKKHFPERKFNFIFFNPYTIKSFFPYKDSVPSLLISNVVYEYVCSSCKRRYVGETKRNLKLRIAEHKGVSARTGRPLTQPSLSQIRSHCQQSNHEFSESDFNILSKVTYPGDTRILESVYIKYLKPQLNNQGASYPLSIL